MGKQFEVNVKGQATTFESKFETLNDAIDALKESGNASEFARDLIEKQERFGLSDKQAAWVHKLAMDGNDRPAPLELGLTNIAKMLAVMPGKGRRKQEVAQGIEVSLNGPKSKNPGHVSVTDGGPYKDNTYFGRIDDNGTVFPGRDWNDEVTQALVAFNNQGQEESNDDIDDTDLPF